MQRKAHYSYVKNFLKIKANFKCDSPPFCNSWKLSNFQQLFSSVHFSKMQNELKQKKYDYLSGISRIIALGFSIPVVIRLFRNDPSSRATSSLLVPVSVQ